MSNVPSIFPIDKIVLTAAIAAGVSLLVLLILRRSSKGISGVDLVMLVIVVGFSVFAWRMAGNVAQLNEDPIPPLSPNDLLCPVITYIWVDIYLAFRHPGGLSQRDTIRALLTVVSLVVNVLFI